MKTSFHYINVNMTPCAICRIIQKMISITTIIDIMSNIHQIYHVLINRSWHCWDKRYFIENHFYTGENIIKMLGFFFWRGWLVLIFTIVLIKFFHKTFVCKSMKQLFFLKNGTMLIKLKKMLKENCIKVHFVLWVQHTCKTLPIVSTVRVVNTCTCSWSKLLYQSY